mmetsp:Transcript_24472/g.66785  ORF Transcript_24472/g.66785 Transcript_24472/m.66785 type:complete len:199 (+) Transcript_24472:2136-2732(+)
MAQQQAPLLSLAWQRYLVNLNKHPLRTKALTSACVAGLSDAIAQSSSNNKGWLWRRTGAIMLYGLIWGGPGGHYWQKFMEILFKGKADFVTVLKKVAFDQVTFGPLCNIMFMSFATLVLERKSLQFLGQKVRRDYPTVQLNGWKVWPLAALINYGFVPVQFRVLFANVVALFWSIFLLQRAKKLANNTVKQKQEQDKQ